jgi:tetratricopeptide (TPR) repeat protein
MLPGNRMSRIKDLKRQLEAARDAIETLDADLAAGRLSDEEHARARAERERETGRLYVSLRRLQREAPESAKAADTPRDDVSAWRNPLVVVPLAVALLIAGVGAGVAIGRLVGGGTRADTVATGAARDAKPGISEIELQALRQAAAREDAPVPSLLQFAHGLLDSGRLDESRQIYERVLKREPRNAEAITHVGAVLFQQGRLEEALGKVEEALRIDPTYLHAHWDRAQYLFHGKRDYAAAMKAGEAFLKLVPQGPDAENMRALIAQAREQANRAPLAPRGR